MSTPDRSRADGRRSDRPNRRGTWSHWSARTGTANCNKQNPRLSWDYSCLQGLVVAVVQDDRILFGQIDGFGKIVLNKPDVVNILFQTISRVVLCNPHTGLFLGLLTRIQQGDCNLKQSAPISS
jgi:hypothetical protein